MRLTVTATPEEGTAGTYIESFQIGPEIPVHQETTTTDHPDTGWGVGTSRPVAGIGISFERHDRCLEEVFIRVKSGFGHSIVYRYTGLSLITHHHAKDNPAFVFREKGKVSVKR